MINQMLFSKMLYTNVLYITHLSGLVKHRLMSESSGSVKLLAFPRKANCHASYYANNSRKSFLILKGFHH